MRQRVSAVLSSAAIIIAMVMPAVAADRTETVRLGKQEVSRTGEIKGKHTLTYELRSKRGQALDLNFFPVEGSCGFKIYAPGMAAPMFQGGQGAGAFSGTLSENGNYRVRIAMTGGSKRCRFNISFKSRS